jgi:hypothetical protein
VLLCTEVVSASCRITPVPLRASIVIVVMHLYTAVHGTTEMAHGEGHAGRRRKNGKPVLLMRIDLPMPRVQ